MHRYWEIKLPLFQNSYSDRKTTKMVFTRTDLEEIKKIMGEVINEQLKDQLADSIYRKIENKFQGKIKVLENDLIGLKSDLANTKKENQSLKMALDSSEQFSRVRNIRIFGMDEAETEDLFQEILNLFTVKMKVNSINISDIKACHRVEAKNPVPDKPRTVLVSFNSVNKRTEVLKSRKLLKNTKISIKEDLTQYRLKLLSAAVAKFSSKNAWCLHGNIYVRSAGVVHRVGCDTDIQQLNV